MIDLRKSDHAYFFGFILADGHLSVGTRQRGRLAVELKSEDRALLERFSTLFPVHSSLTTRTRDTNFKSRYETAVWRVYDLDFRSELLALGMPIGSKSLDVRVPADPYDRPAFFRGIIDADGSLGLTAKGIPFVSLVTKSEALAQAYLHFVQEVTGLIKTSTRNRRDGVFNIVVFKEGAQSLASAVYLENCLALPRKMKQATEVSGWIRPSTMKRVDGRRRWTPEEDELIRALSPVEASVALGRTLASIKLRLWRLSQDVTL